MKLHLAFLFIFSALILGAPLRAQPAAKKPEPPPESTNPPEKQIKQVTQEEGDEHTYEVDSTYRSEHIYPSNWGLAGIFRVRSAESLPAGALTFGVGGEFYSVSDAPDMGFGNRNAQTITENLFVGYAPTQRLTLALMRRSSSTTFGNPQNLISSLGDFHVSAMYSVPLTPILAIAPYTDFLIASNFNNLSPSGNTVSVGVGAAATLSMYRAWGVPLFVHANVGYHMPQIRNVARPGIQAETYFQFSRFNTLNLGLGAEYKMGDFIPFVEFQDTVHSGSGLSFGQMPSRFSVGSRITPIANKSLAFLVGADITVGRGLVPGVPFSPGYQILGQVSYTVGLQTTERKHYFTTADVNIIDRRFVINKNINFKVGSAELEPSSTDILDQIVQVTQQNKVKKLLIVGHTDSSHTEDYNLKLSQDRAASVKRYLVTHGIAEDTLMSQGYGKRKPRATNLTEEGRALNRRVEFFILE